MTNANKYIGSYTLGNDSAVAIKKFNHEWQDEVEWDVVCGENVLESGVSIVEYTDEEATFKVGEMDIALSECLRIS